VDHAHPPGPTPPKTPPTDSPPTPADSWRAALAQFDRLPTAAFDALVDRVSKLDDAPWPVPILDPAEPTDSTKHLRRARTVVLSRP
jgi:hypothetical protein